MIKFRNPVIKQVITTDRENMSKLDELKGPMCLPAAKSHGDSGFVVGRL